MQKTIESLSKCLYADNSDIIVYSDGYKGDADKHLVEAVRQYLSNLHSKSVFKSVTIYEQETNKGLATSIISGVTEIISTYGKIIVVEDDLIVSKDFIQYMNDALDYYENEKKYGCISAYTPPLKSLKTYGRNIYITHKGDCWGWATWKDRWMDIDWKLQSFDEYLNDHKKRKAFSDLEDGLEDQLIMQHAGKMDAWAARWCVHLFNKRMLTVYPCKCRAINIGLDNSGDHCSNMSNYENDLNCDMSPCKFELLDVDYKLEKENAHYSRKGFFPTCLDYARIVINKFKR